MKPIAQNARTMSLIDAFVISQETSLARGMAKDLTPGRVTTICVSVHYCFSTNCCKLQWKSNERYKLHVNEL